MKTQNAPFYYLSRHRTTLMGLSILWIVWFHSSFYLDFFPWDRLNHFFYLLKTFGYGGVDIFLIISGMGIYQSLKKNDTFTFLKNRIRKIIPVWWLFLIIYFIVGIVFLNVSMRPVEAIGFATLSGYWIDLPNQGNWYVYAIMLFYLLSPVLFAVLKSKNKAGITVLFFTTVLLPLAFLGKEQLMAVSRFPVYISGMFLSSHFSDRKMNRGNWLLCILSLLAGIALLGFLYHSFSTSALYDYGLWWWPFILIAPSLSILTSLLLELAGKHIRFLSVPISFLGKASLEILLTSECVFAALEASEFVFLSEHVTGLASILFSILLGLLIHFCIEFCKKKLQRKKAAG